MSTKAGAINLLLALEFGNTLTFDCCKGRTNSLHMGVNPGECLLWAPFKWEGQMQLTGCTSPFQCLMNSFASSAQAS